MNIMLMIVIAEGVILFLVIACFLFFLWKKKKKQVVEFEVFLGSVKEAEIERKVLLSKTLMDRFALANDDANESSKAMVEAEKKFLQLFLRQQMEQTPIIEVYENLCELLDQYLHFVEIENNTQGEIEEDNISEENLAEDVGNNDEDQDEEVDWNDAFSESGDALDEEAEDGRDSQQQAMENEGGVPDSVDQKPD